MKKLLLAVFLIATLGFLLSACDDFRWHGAGADGDMDSFENSDADTPDGDADKDLDNADGDSGGESDGDSPDNDSEFENGDLPIGGILRPSATSADAVRTAQIKLRWCPGELQKN